jgi:dynein heavy chain, axonemal
MDKLFAFKKSIFDVWTLEMPNNIEVNLKKHLLIRNPDNLLLSLNFDIQLLAVLREVRNLTLMGTPNIPKCGIEFAERGETFRIYNMNLEKTIEWYNRIRKNSTKVELDMIKEELQFIDDTLEKAITVLDWNSERKLTGIILD